MPKTYAAFLSYSHRYADWVETLHANLGACLDHAGETRRVFLDQVDLGTGRSWVGQLQAGLDQADQLVLVVTPEALASPRVKDEWANFIAMHPDWEGRLQVAMLVDTPRPPFLTAIHSRAGCGCRAEPAVARGLLWGRREVCSSCGTAPAAAAQRRGSRRML